MSGTSATLLGVMAAALIAVFGAVWRLGNKIGEINAYVKENRKRIGRMDKHQQAHDLWHLNRGDR